MAEATEKGEDRREGSPETLPPAEQTGMNLNLVLFFISSFFLLLIKSLAFYLAPLHLKLAS